jgi:hypothetical protein
MNKHGLYSKAAEIIRSLPQEKGTVDQYIAAAKARGAKPSELEHAGRPEGDKITREEMAKHFEGKMPKMYVSQYGENPSYMPPGSGKRFMDLQVRSFKSDNPLSPEEERELAQMRMRHSASPNVITEPNDDEEDEQPSDTNYGGYTIPGGKNYRERLMTLGTDKDKPRYNSSHWTDHDNVLAHIRMSDRTVEPTEEQIEPILQKLAKHQGLNSWKYLASGAVHPALQNKIITPQEAADVSRFMKWRNGYDQAPGTGKRLLHVEELQSDWGQEGRDKGFHDPENPYEVVNRYTKEVVSQHPDYQSMWDAYRTAPNSNDLDIITAKNEKPPAAPYVQNTQHWTDLALKNVLREAALGNYEGVVFSPGQAQADRYGLEKHLDTLAYYPDNQSLVGYRNKDNVFQQANVKPEDVKSHVGSEIAERLLNESNARNVGTRDQVHVLQGGDLKAGGLGMKGYYDNIVPKSVMRLAQQHDPAAKPGAPVQIGDYQGFHLPMTDTLKNNILDKGFSAFKRGGAVDVGKALSVTRSFTKDGRAAMMRLKD